MTVAAGGDGRVRCGWADFTGPRWDAADSVLYRTYHDTEWGRPLHDARDLFERMSLEAFQSGLSWLTILRKREAFRAGFAHFEADQLARFGEAEVTALLADAGIIRHRGKIEAAIANARALVALWERGGSLAELIWSFEPARGRVVAAFGDVPAQTPESVALSRELKKQGFRFVGPTTIYAAMQAMGVVNDHLTGCWVRDACESSRAAATFR